MFPRGLADARQGLGSPHRMPVQDCRPPLLIRAAWARESLMDGDIAATAGWPARVTPRCAESGNQRNRARQPQVRHGCLNAVTPG